MKQCLVPKYIGDDGVMDHAYTMGHFRSTDTVDYAVVCHIPDRKIQQVVVYSNFEGVWRGEVIDRGTFDNSLNADKCETQVSVAKPAAIRSYAQAFAPEELKRLPDLDHDGVEINLCDKASTIHYLSHGRWLQFLGAD